MEQYIPCHGQVNVKPDESDDVVGAYQVVAIVFEVFEEGKAMTYIGVDGMGFPAHRVERFSIDPHWGYNVDG